jgi:hypothetical protein
MPFPVEEKYIIETEKELNIIFPSHFKNRMKKINGGDLISEKNAYEFELFPFYDQSDQKSIGRTYNHIGSETENARKMPNFPNDAVAIGDDGCGNYIILIPENDKILSEKIYLLRYEYEEFEEIATSIKNFDF